MDIMGRAKEFIPDDKILETVSHVYRCVIYNMYQERKASRIAIPALSTEREAERRMKLCFDELALMLDPRGLDMGYIKAMDFLPQALWHAVNGGQWKDDPIVSQATYNKDALARYDERKNA